MSLPDGLIEDELLLPPPIVGTIGPPDMRTTKREIFISIRTDGASGSGN